MYAHTSNFRQVKLLWQQQKILPLIELQPRGNTFRITSPGSQELSLLLVNKFAVTGAKGESVESVAHIEHIELSLQSGAVLEDTGPLAISLYGAPYLPLMVNSQLR